MAHETITARVARKWLETPDACALELVPADGGRLPAFAAGAHVDVHLPGGLVRQYSLLNDPAETHRYCIAVLREPASRGGSAAVHEHVAEGQLLTIGAPRNAFALAPVAHRRLLLAGGIGITPLLCMAEQSLREGADFALHYAARSASRMAFRERLAEPRWQGRVHLHPDDGDAAQRLDLEALLRAPAPGLHLYACGPAGLLQAALGTARRLGWQESNLHWEQFAATPMALSAEPAGDAPFEIELARSGRVLHVPAGMSAAQVLVEAGTGLLTSCEQGVCGTCLTRVLAGTPDHRDAYLTPDERAANDQFLPCRSRARCERLVVDL
jgi:vanillate O-demethylase ferredoxin subunit